MCYLQHNLFDTRAFSAWVLKDPTLNLNASFQNDKDKGSVLWDDDAMPYIIFCDS
jgi:hypothetical protein